MTKEANAEGIYRVRICKNGVWVDVLVDDLLPCEPLGGTLFAGCMNNEIWIALLEKAYAKVHGSYYLLQGGFVSEALQDLTGCPTSCYNLSDETVVHFVQNGQFWELLKHFWNEGYLMALSTPGEERWTSINEKRVDRIKFVDDDHTHTRTQRENALPLGQGFAIV